jgi:hypothetical protein
LSLAASRRIYPLIRIELDRFKGRAASLPSVNLNVNPFIIKT